MMPTQEREMDMTQTAARGDEWSVEWQAQAVREAAALLRAMRDGGEEAFARQAALLTRNVPQ